jgi:LacI family transcriptional regulator
MTTAGGKQPEAPADAASYPVTLRELAQRVGVNISTVSRVLNRDPGVRISTATRARILDVAAATGYRPNRLARSLKLQRTHIVGMLIPDVTNPVFSALFRAVDDAASAAGYHVILCNTDDTVRRLEQHLDTLSEGHVDGLLVATARRDDPVLDTLRARRLPYVLVHRRRENPGDCWVVPDDRQAAHLVVEHLRRLGHRRIAHIAGSAAVSRSVERRAGFQEALTAAGLGEAVWVAAAGDVDETAGELGLTQLMTVPSERRPTAVFAANDLAALGVLSAAQRIGLRLPADLSVVGSDDIPAGWYAGPGLTTIRLPVQEMGRLATELLIRRIRGEVPPDAPPTQTTLPVELVVRGSTAAPAPRLST